MLDDFRAYMPDHKYIFIPSRELWPSSSVNARLGRIDKGDDNIAASTWLDRYAPVEQMTWAQLGQHRKPILVANIDGFWDPLLGLLDHMHQQAFIRAEYPINLLVAERVEDILPRLRAAAPPAEEREVASPAIERM